MSHDNSLLYKLVETEEQRYKLRIHRSLQVENLIFSALLMIGLNVYVGWREEGSILWVFNDNLLFWIAAAVFLVLIAAMWIESWKEFRADRRDVYYPPLADEQLKEKKLRDEKRADEQR